MPIRFDRSKKPTVPEAASPAPQAAGSTTPPAAAADGAPAAAVATPPPAAARCTVVVPAFSRDRRAGDVRDIRPLAEVVAALRDRSTLSQRSLSDWLCNLGDCLEEEPEASQAEPALKSGGFLADYNTALSCAVAAVEADWQNPVAWNCLGVEISRSSSPNVTMSDGKAYNERGAYLQALVVDKDHGAAWCNLGADVVEDGSLEVEGTSYTEEQLLVRAVELNEYRAASWSNLAALLSRRADNADAPPTVTVHGHAFTEKMARYRALQAGPRKLRAFAYWGDMANCMAPTDTIWVEDRVFTTVDVAVKSVELKPSAPAWNTLGIVIASGNHREVQCLGARVDTLACFIRGLEEDPGYDSLWRNLEVCLSRSGQDNPTVVIQGHTLTLEDCRMYATQSATFPPQPPQNGVARAFAMAAVAGVVVGVVSAAAMYALRQRRSRS